MRKLFLLMLLTGLAGIGYAQDVLTGRVYENKTNNFLRGIRVEDLKSHAVTMTGQDGSFTLKASKGDLVTFTNFNYRPDTVFLTTLTYLQVFLVLKTTLLDEVKVSDQQIKNGAAGFKTQKDTGVFGSNVVKYQRNDDGPNKGSYKGGVTFKIPDGGETQRQHEAKVEAKQKDQDRIRRVFNPDTLKKYVSLTGQEMINFVIMYTPDAKTFFDPQFNIITYVNASYREFMKIPEEDRKSKSLTELPAIKE
jgi:hypothetical protein